MGRSRVGVLGYLLVFSIFMACGGGGDEPADTLATDEGLIPEDIAADVQADPGAAKDEGPVDDVPEEVDEGASTVDCAVDNGGCHPNATCEVDGQGEALCTCQNGWEGDGFSCSDIDECAGENGCDPVATCENSEGSYSCACPEAYEGDGLNCTDIDECLGEHGCGENTECVNEPGGFTCACSEGYEGEGSACTDVDECANELDDCSDNGICSNIVGSYNCSCQSGYEGDGVTCTDVDECANLESPVCLGGASCSNTEGGFDCLCEAGYTYDESLGSCVDLDECTTPEVPSCDPNAICTNTEASFTCECSPGFIGVGYDCAVDPDNCGCFNVNECDAGFDDCDPNASCSDTPGSFDCTCNPGFEGDGLSCVDIDECQTGVHDCALDAICTNTVGSYSCGTLCDSYCEKINQNCTGSNEIDFGGTECLTNCALWPEGFLGATTGNSVYCRLLYGGALAVSDPDTNCAFAAPDGGGMCVDNGGSCSNPKPLGATGVATMFGNAPSITQSLGICDNDTSPGYGAWFQYVVSESGPYMISATNDTETLAHSRLVLYEGAGCGASSVEQQCTTAPGKEVSMIAELEAGTVYLVHVYSDGPTFTLVNPTVSIQPYEESTTGFSCENSEDVSASDFPAGLTGQFTVDGAGGSCSPVATNQVWFSYTPESTDNFKITVSNEDSSAWGRVVVYKSSGCESLLTFEVECVEFTASGGEVVAAMQEGETYKIQYYTDGESYPMTNPGITIEPVVVVSGGQSCDTAADVSSLSFPVELNGFFAEDPLVTKSCGEATAYNSVWFLYTPAFSGEYTIELNNAFTLAYGRVAVFDGGGCLPLGIEAACATSDVPGVNVTLTMSADQTYVILYHTDGDDWSMQNPTISVFPAL